MMLPFYAFKYVIQLSTNKIPKSTQTEGCCQASHEERIVCNDSFHELWAALSILSYVWILSLDLILRLSFLSGKAPVTLFTCHDCHWL